MEPFDGFDWNGGNGQKCQKHGVSIAEIELLLTVSAKIAPDLKHSQSEERSLAIGRDSRGRAMFVVFTVRSIGNQTLVCPISARYMHKKESQGYEEEEGSSL